MIRKEQGLTQLDIAGLAGISNRFVIALERGKETLQIQKVLDVLRLLGLELSASRKPKWPRSTYPDSKPNR